MASRFDVQGYPTIKYFPSGKKRFDSAEGYDGGRKHSDIVSWAMSRWMENLPPPEVYQVNYMYRPHLTVCMFHSP